jgi:hypothetical protein
MLTGTWIEILYTNGKFNCVHTLNLKQTNNIIEGVVTKTEVGAYI